MMKKLLLLLVLVLPFALWSQTNESKTKKESRHQKEQFPSIEGTPLIWGVDDAGATHHPTSDVAKRIIQEFGFDLVVQHYKRPYLNPSRNTTIANLKQFHKFYNDLNIRWILNLETANWAKSFVDEDGYDWYNRADGRHYFQFPDQVLMALSKMKNKPGLMYDEAAHMQNNRNRPTIKDFEAPFFMNEEQAVSLEQASSNFTKEVRKIAEQYEKYGLQVYSEHVFPIMYHPFAKAGFTAVSKILKESVSPAYIASSLGAALQYDRPFWLTPDLWHMGVYPGHSTDMYRSALLMAYHMGAECIYTENISFDHKKQGKGSLVLLDAEKTDYKVTDHGKIAKWFRQTYAPENPRYYRFQDIKPRVAIIRQEDASWGQSNSGFPDWLFGVKSWKSTANTEAWFHIWHLLSDGKINKHGLSWHNREVRKKPNQFLFPLDGVVAFDETVRMKHLDGVELIFLTGLSVSRETLEDVKKCVKNGAICISLPHLVPDDVKLKTGAKGKLKDGKGEWVVTNSFLDLKDDSVLKPFLPRDNAMSYRFGDTEVKFKPTNGDFNKIQVEVSTVLAN